MVHSRCHGHFLAMSDYVHIKSQVFTLKWWKYIKCDQLYKNNNMKSRLYAKMFVNDDSIRMFCYVQCLCRIVLAERTSV